MGQQKSTRTRGGSGYPFTGRQCLACGRTRCAFVTVAGALGVRLDGGGAEGAHTDALHLVSAVGDGMAADENAAALDCPCAAEAENKYTVVSSR